MHKEFENKNFWAVILGGSSGLGLASAKKLASHGMNICIVHRDRRIDLNEIQKNFDEIISKGVDLLSFNADGINPEKRKEIISRIKKEMGEKGKIRVFLHSIAKGNLKPMLNNKTQVLKNEDFKLTIESMAISLHDWVQEIFQNNLFSGDARVISFTSEGSTKAWKNYGAVSASKAALEAITRNIALELAPFGIRANCIQAGITDTKSFRMIPGSEQLKDYSKIRNPFNRLTTPEDIANAVYLLSLDEASWINGTVIPVNGGEHLS
jgi:enoyl-[acyl-carrier protein] reductase III